MVQGVYWCLNCNLPLLSRKCDKCESEGKFIALSRAADVRPAFENDMELIKKLIINWCKSSSLSVLDLKNRIILLNRLPYLDKAYEVVFNGEIFAHIFFDLYSLKWKIKPFKPLLQLLRRFGIDYPFAILNKEQIERGDLLSSEDLKKSSFDENDEYVCLCSKNHEILGLGQNINGKLLVLRVWKKSNNDVNLERRTDWKNVLEANKWQIEILRSKACKFLSKCSTRFRRKPIISYSGGKDSLACLLISLEAGVEAEMLFVDTCLEMPETIQNVNKVIERFQLKAHVVKANLEKFWEKFNLIGPPARDFRWCSRICKLEPTNRALTELGSTLCIVGQRRAESFKRASSPNIWKNPYVQDSISVTPISNWKALHIWLYVMEKKAENLMNELYFKGFDRVGCYMCPSATVADMQKVKCWHPKLWEGWENALKEWKKKQGLDDNWLKYALWRWRKRIPKGIKNFLRKMLN